MRTRLNSFDDSDVARRAARKFVSDSELDDVAQETLLHAIRSEPPSGPSRSQWIACVARRVAIDRWRSNDARRRREEIYSSGRRVSGFEDIAGEDSNGLEGHLGSLDAPTRELLELRYIQGHSFAEIAQQIGLPVGTVRTRHYRAIAQLRAQLTQRDGSGEPRSIRNFGVVALSWIRRFTPKSVAAYGLVVAVACIPLLMLLLLRAGTLPASVAGIAMIEGALVPSMEPELITVSKEVAIAVPVVTSTGSPESFGTSAATPQLEATRVVVIGSDGRPIAGITVSAYGDMKRGEPLDWGISGTDGVVDLHGRGAWLLAEHPKEGVSMWTNAPNDNDGPVFLGLMKADAQLTGRVTDKEGHAIVGAIVTLAPLPRAFVKFNRQHQFTSARPAPLVSSDDRGSFEFWIPSRMLKRSMVITSPGFRALHLPIADLARTKLTLLRGDDSRKPVVLTHLRSPSGAPLSSWPVYLDPLPDIPLDSAAASRGFVPRRIKLISGLSGELYVPEGHSAKSRLMVASPTEPLGWVYAATSLRELKDPWTIDLDPPTMGGMEGVATPGSFLFASSAGLIAPLAVEIDPMNGSFALNGLPQGAVTLDGRSHNGLRIPKTTVNIQRGQTTRSVDMRASQPHFIDIRLEPVPKEPIVVWAFFPDGSEVRVTSLMAKTVRPLEMDYVSPTGVAQINAPVSGRYRFAVAVGEDQAGSGVLDLDVTSSERTELVMRTHEVAARTVHLPGLPECPFVRVTVTEQHGSEVWRTPMTLSNARSEIMLPLQPGSFRLSVEPSGFPTMEYDLVIEKGKTNGSAVLRR